jgi:hypothetical protein
MCPRDVARGYDAHATCCTRLLSEDLIAQTLGGRFLRKCYSAPARAAAQEPRDKTPQRFRQLQSRVRRASR